MSDSSPDHWKYTIRCHNSGTVMDFYEVLNQIHDLLRRRGRVAYRALQRQFDLADEDIEALKDELIYAQQVAADEDNRVLVWAGDNAQTSSPPSSSPTQDRDPASYTPQHLAEKILTTRGALEGERKQVTVMFADIKDSTELIRDLDPEAAQQLLDPAIHIMMDAVHRFEGTVNQVLGDGIMALFGAPISHEDHAARACYAALAMQAAMQAHTTEVRQSHGLTLRIRVGLNAGEVVVRTIGNDLHMDYSAVGPTTHLAARMEQLADPGSIVLTASTLRLVEGFVRVNALGAVPIKGMSEPVDVYELTGASTIRRRLQAAVARGLTKFVGRDTEIDALAQALERAKAGAGQMVAAVGEAGLGKSRLFYEFIRSHRTQGWRVLESASVSYGKATPYFPVIDLLKRYAHVEEGDDARTVRAKLTGQVLTLDEALHDITPALLALCDVMPDDHPFLRLDPPQRRQRTLDGLKRLILRESQEQPLLLVFEDLHWIDSETRALLDNLVESLPTAQLLLMVNYRPEYQHTWGSKTFYTQLRLDPLPAESADVFLQSLLGDDPSLVPLKPLLIDRTQGNPFFLEETVRALFETEILVGAPGAYRLARELPTIQVPATVQAILAARIDRLPQEEKGLLQTAAVIGTEAPFTLLHAIAERSEEMLYRDLTHLQAAEFLYETSLFPERAYTFKHALTHEVAYGSLLQERRRALHARIVEVLEVIVGGRRPDEQVERLAYHALRGEVWDKALLYYRQAGTKAMEQSAYREAVTCFEQALEALQHLPECRETLEQAIDLRLHLRNALIAIGDWQRVQTYLREAERLAETLDDVQRLGRLYVQLSVQSLGPGAYDEAITYCQRAFALATANQDVGLQAWAMVYHGYADLSRGDYDLSINHLMRAATLLEGDQSQEHFGGVIPVRLHVCAWLAQCHAELGTFSDGLLHGEEGLRIAQAADRPLSFMAAYRGLGWLYLRRGELTRALTMLERAVTICQEANFALYFITVAPALGAVYTLTDRVTEAVAPLTQAIAQATAMGIMFQQARSLVSLGEAYLLTGHVESASQCATKALQLSLARRERSDQAYTLRLLGNIAMHRDPPEIEQAATHYQQSLVLANELGMRPLQAHCHRGLGALHRQTGQAEQACAELSTAVEMYRDMEMTFWLSETEG